ncbi:hypothetical protein JKP88DRAFT_247429 [Tribonema minus]|uniref:Uncharacterized protein n=1 Tax=Tribonema minus TaxID=303371 RepID=A0A835YYD3_9STRA|nr:hypothetical protein JKP88DRAFT_247429 [Tribonema minus]
MAFFSLQESRFEGRHTAMMVLAGFVVRKILAHVIGRTAGACLLVALGAALYRRADARRGDVAREMHSAQEAGAHLSGELRSLRRASLTMRLPPAGTGGHSAPATLYPATAVRTRRKRAAAAADPAAAHAQDGPLGGSGSAACDVRALAPASVRCSSALEHLLSRHMHTAVRPTLADAVLRAGGIGSAPRRLRRRRAAARGAGAARRKAGGRRRQRRRRRRQRQQHAAAAALVGGDAAASTAPAHDAAHGPRGRNGRGYDELSSGGGRLRGAGGTCAAGAASLVNARRGSGGAAGGGGARRGHRCHRRQFMWRSARNVSHGAATAAAARGASRHPAGLLREPPQALALPPAFCASAAAAAAGAAAVSLHGAHLHARRSAQYRRCARRLRRAPRARRLRSEVHVEVVR